MNHKHFFRYKGYFVGDPTHMCFVCETCNEVCHVRRWTWNFLVKGA